MSSAKDKTHPFSIRSLTTLLLAVSILFSLVPAMAAGASGSTFDIPDGETELTGTIKDSAVPKGFFSNSSALSSYITNTMRFSSSASVARANSTGVLGSRLSGTGKKLYDSLLTRIKNVAAGKTSSTVFYPTFTPVYSVDLLNNSVKQLKATVKTAVMDVVEALLQDCPSELYWFDKTVGWSWTYDWKILAGDQYVQITDFQIKFFVAKEYSASGAVETTKVSTSKGKAIQTAAANAKKIVEKYRSKSDTEKLRGYKNEICALNDYNSKAANDSGMPYGNPWQLVWVFDGNPKTKVVCEGYAKAFQYLCELTSFSSSVSSMVMTGTLFWYKGDTAYGGRHMWNVVKMSNGKRYMVDVTNCDKGSSGSNKLFLVGYDRKESTELGNAYVYGDLYYVFDKDVTSLYTDSDRNLNSSDYDPVIYSGKCGTDAKWSLRKRGTLKITGSGSVTSNPWIQYKDKIRTIEIGSSITSIFKRAFKGCDKVTSVTIGKKLKTIEKEAFKNCSKLKTVTIRSTVLSKVGSKAFDKIASGAVFKCPAIKLSVYKKLLKNAGAPGNAKYQKN